SPLRHPSPTRRSSDLSASTAKLAAAATLWLGLVRTRNPNMISAANDARVSDARHVGGVFSRRSRAVIRDCFLRSSAVGGRPVRRSEEHTSELQSRENL